MFIKPIDIATLPSSSAAFQDKAGNTHFHLQSKIKASSLSARSFLTGLGSALSGGAGGGSSSGTLAATDAAYRKSIANDFEFRILLNLTSRKQSFVIAVDESFEKIHHVC